MPSVKSHFDKHAPTRRLRPVHLALCVLFVGWIPSIFLAYYSYTVLSHTLESKTIADAESLTRSLSQHIQNEIERAGESMDYYRTLPVTATMLQPAPPTGTAAATPPPATPRDRRGRPAAVRGEWAAAAASPPSASTAGAYTSVAAPAPPSPQEWLNSIFYPQRIDGMFLTDASGRLVASLPHSPDSSSPQQQFSTGVWKTAADFTHANYYLSSTYLRAADNRRVASVVVAIHDRAKNLLGYLGADILVERIGRRLESLDLKDTPETTIQIIDQNGFPLFAKDFQPNRTEQATTESDLLRAFRRHRSGTEERGDDLYNFAAIGHTGWIAVIKRQGANVHQPIRDLLRQTLLLVGWLIVGTAGAAYLLSSFYRQQLQSSLRSERAQIFNEKILANMPVGIALIDPGDERLLQVNSAFVEIVRSLGALPRKQEVAEATFAQLAIASREALARVLHFGVPYQAIEQRTPTANGQIRYLTTNLLRLQDRDLRTLGVLCLVEDSTAPVILRQELINANTAKDQFLAQLSHELRNPLSPVITMVAELEHLAADVPAAREPLEIIRRNVELEARLIDDLLDVTRISSGKLQLNRSLTDVHRTLGLALEICQREIDEKGLQIRLALDAREHFTVADSGRLQQVFWNLLKNAVKFTPSGRKIVVRSTNLAASLASAGGGKTHISFISPAAQPPAAAPVNLEDTLAVFGNDCNGGPTAPENGGNGQGRAAGGHHGFLRIEIVDEGIGIEPQNLGRIFNAFDQGQSSITQRFGGLGLGLAISKAMVEAHGGNLSVFSEGTDKGSVFTVELETCPAPAVETLPPPSPAASVGEPADATVTPAATIPSGEGYRVLLIDDHIDTCLGMEKLLKRRGYEVVTAHSVAGALQQNDVHAPFDLIISDLGLPDGTGFELMSELRRRGGPPGIALSGFGMESDIDKSHDAGFSEHLIKPVAIDRLDEVMRRLLVKAVTESSIGQPV